MSICVLPKELQEKAKNELNEDPDQNNTYIQHIQDWLQKQPHLNVRTENEWLLNFLRCSKFSIQRAKERLDFFYTMRTLAPEFLRNKDPMLTEIQDILQKGMLFPVLKTSETDGPVTFIVRWGLGNPEKNSYIDICKAIFMSAEILLNENDNFKIAGVQIIEDFQDFPYNYLLQQTPALCKKSILTVQNAYPIRIKSVHCINVPVFFDTFFSLFKPFLSEKLKNRIKLCTSEQLDELYHDIPKSILPIEYGGTGGYFKDLAAEWKKKMESYRKWFLEDEQYLSNEMKRPGEPKTSADVFGVEGSFRKLNID